MDKLSKCPFCNGEPVLNSKCNYRETGGDTMYFIECKGCQCQTAWSTQKDKVIKLWNTREAMITYETHPNNPQR